jgi:intracellular multiplication protein IcmV
MGFFSRMKDASGYLVNFKVTSWMGLDQVKSIGRNVAGMGRQIFTPNQAEYTETFEEALVRLNITEAQLEQRRKEFTRLMIIYILVACALFTYSIYVIYAHKNIMGFIMSFAITLFALTHVFRYHFWIYQIKHKKLGCTLREWFSGKV